MKLTTLQALEEAQQHNRSRRGLRIGAAVAVSAAVLSAYLWKISTGPVQFGDVPLEIGPTDLISVGVALIVLMSAAVVLQQVELQLTHRTRMRFYRDVATDAEERTGIEIPLEAIRADHGSGLTYGTRDGETVPVQVGFEGDTTPIRIQVLTTSTP